MRYVAAGELGDAGERPLTGKMPIHEMAVCRLMRIEKIHCAILW